MYYALDLSAIDNIEGMSDLHKKQLKGELAAQYKSDAQAYFKEFQRYKQDCRKRALDLAHDQVNAPEYRKFMEENTFVKEPLSKDELPKPVVKEESLLMLADKYYNWLISIPETK